MEENWVLPPSKLELEHVFTLSFLGSFLDDVPIWKEKFAIKPSTYQPRYISKTSQTEYFFKTFDRVNFKLNELLRSVDEFVAILTRRYTYTTFHHLPNGYLYLIGIKNFFVKKTFVFK